MKPKTTNTALNKVCVRKLYRASVTPCESPRTVRSCSEAFVRLPGKQVSHDLITCSRPHICRMPLPLRFMSNTSRLRRATNSGSSHRKLTRRCCRRSLRADQRDNKGSESIDHRSVAPDTVQQDGDDPQDTPALADGEHETLTLSAQCAPRAAYDAASTSTNSRQRREASRQKRINRRACPYSAGRRERQGGTRQGPTPGETQVMMSLWGL